MAEVTKAEPVKTEPYTELRLWIGLLLPPVVWAVQLQTIYLTSEYGCFTSRFFWNHAASAAAFVLSLIGLAVAWCCWRSLGMVTEDQSATTGSRQRFMAILGTFGGVLFTLLIVAIWLPTIMEVPCDK